MHTTKVRSRRRRRTNRRGASLVLMVFLMTIVMAGVAFSVEIARMYLLRCQVQTAVDSGALAASLALAQDPTDVDEAMDQAHDYIQRNRVGLAGMIPEDAITIEAGQWDEDAQTFVATNAAPNAVRVLGSQDDEPFFFARIFNRTTFGAPASAIASGSGAPLDIMMVLDLSGSMNSQGRIEALRNAAPEFVNVIEDAGGQDQIGVMTYGAESDDFDYSAHDTTPYTNAPSGLYPPDDTWVGVLESDLTDDFNLLRNVPLSSGELIGAKYAPLTPIGAAIRDASHYLSNSSFGRDEVNGVTVKKVIVLMSDGYANRPVGNGPGYARTMADYASDLDIKVYTISLGNGADEALMEDIADQTGGKHFVASGSGAGVLTDELADAFRQIGAALKRPQLVQ